MFETDGLTDKSAHVRLRGTITTQRERLKLPHWYACESGGIGAAVSLHNCVWGQHVDNGSWINEGMNRGKNRTMYDKSSSQFCKR